MKLLILCAIALAGALSARAQGILYNVALDGPTEGNASPGIGTGTVRYDSTAHSLQIVVTFSGLTGTTTAAHIHGATASPFSGTAGVITTTPTFAGFPPGVTSGSYSNTLDLTQSGSFNAAYVTANGGTVASAEAAFAAAMAAGKTYLNLHTSTFGGGEIRGFLTPVPEPASLALMGVGGLLALGLRRKS